MRAYLIPKSFFDILRALKNSPRLVKRLLDENVENDLRLWPTMSMSDENSMKIQIEWKYELNENSDNRYLIFRKWKDIYVWLLRQLFKKMYVNENTINRISLK